MATLFLKNEMRHATTESYLRAVALPEKTETYQPIAHGQFIDWIREASEEAGMEMLAHHFFHGRKGQQMAGSVTYRTESEDEMGFELIYLNSYDKTISATVAAGAKVFVCSNGMLAAENAIKRLHRGEKAPGLVKGFIHDVLSSQGKTMAFLTKQRDYLRGQKLSSREMAQLAGEFYIEERVLSSWELSEVAKQIQSPSFDYGGNNDTAWDFYQHLTHSLKNSQPLNYYEKQVKINRLMDELFSPAI